MADKYKKIIMPEFMYTRFRTDDEGNLEIYEKDGEGLCVTLHEEDLEYLLERVRENKCN